jgi:hypothetical protein
MCLSKLNKIDEYLSTSIDELIISPSTNKVIDKNFVERYNELITKFGATKLHFFFKTSREDKVFQKFVYKDTCPSCNQFFEKEISPTKLKSGIDIKCSVCVEKENEANQRMSKIANAIYQEERKIKRINETKNYIDNYLNPGASFKKDIALYARWNSINYNHYEYNDSEIIQHIKSMDYKSFLQTPYWKTVSYKRKAQCDFKCQLCNSSKDLETHHPRYDIKGEELNNMKKLTVLCHACHEKHHK